MIAERKLCLLSFVLVLLCAIAGCGSHPSALRSARDIRRASPELEQIRIGLLPLVDYPCLSKFKRVRDIDFFTLDGTGANDEKLEALSKLKLERLTQLSLLNCRAVTDVGIGSLAGISSLRGLQLEGTAISDEALATIASRMTITGVNVANCPGVSIAGIRKLAASESITDISFSLNTLTQEEVYQLLRTFKRVKWVGIVDPDNRVDGAALSAVAKARGITLNISRTGSLQDAVH